MHAQISFLVSNTAMTWIPRSFVWRVTMSAVHKDPTIHVTAWTNSSDHDVYHLGLADLVEQEGTLSLIHIPLDLYPSLLQPILKILLPPSRDPYYRRRSSSSTSVNNEECHPHHHHGSFLNISVTPIECSIVCDAAWAESVFRPALARLSRDQSRTVAISGDTYAVLNVYGTGMDAGSRVADLTSPLALAGIPIFFITTYYSDYILVPVKARQAVVKALLAQGFVFSGEDHSQLISSPSASIHHHPPLTTTPTPPSTIDDLQHRTFTLLRNRNVTPLIHPGLTLVQCTGASSNPTTSTNGTTTSISSSRHHHHTSSTSSSSRTGGRRPSAPPSWVDTVDARLYTALVAALAAQPRFLSVTLAHEDPPSLLMDRALLPVFGGAVMAGTAAAVDEDYYYVEYDEHGSPGGGDGVPSGGGSAGSGGLVPIFLDLADLPFEATGIVSGVAGRLVREMRGEGVGGGGGGGGMGCELSYLSTARSGAVILSAEQAAKAMGVLEPVLKREDGGVKG
ncbi:hypothetical protein VTJ49DRAFT_3537 [Mycothermus thermophilus]|uniref:CASTOR ACT domain-containing protein n=1 Tax=Humicola insolens TaxID=85995 RepID=A0ABR3V8C0_HUMIN